MDHIDEAIAEIRAVKEADEYQEKLKSIKDYNAVINFGNPLVKHDPVHLTLWITLKTGEVVEVVGNFDPQSIYY